MLESESTLSRVYYVGLNVATNFTVSFTGLASVHSSTIAPAATAGNTGLPSISVGQMAARTYHNA